MSYTQSLKKISKHFGLTYKGSLKFLKCSHREVALRNFLAGCPAPGYPQYGSLKDNREKYIEKFSSSTVFRQEQDGNSGTVISKEAARRELARVKKISNPTSKKELVLFYNRVIKHMGTSKRLILIASNQHSGFNEVLLHEFVHELINENKLVIKPWLRNEGLVTYLTSYGLGEEQIFDEKNPKVKTSKIYIAHAKKWRRLFRKTNKPTQRLNLIKEKAT